MESPPWPRAGGDPPRGKFDPGEGLLEIGYDIPDAFDADREPYEAVGDVLLNPLFPRDEGLAGVMEAGCSMRVSVSPRLTARGGQAGIIDPFHVADFDVNLAAPIPEDRVDDRECDGHIGEGPDENVDPRRFFADKEGYLGIRTSPIRMEPLLKSCGRIIIRKKIAAREKAMGTASLELTFWPYLVPRCGTKRTDKRAQSIMVSETAQLF